VNGAGLRPGAGIGKGELVQIETARTLAEEMRAAYPSMYP